MANWSKCIKHCLECWRCSLSLCILLVIILTSGVTFCAVLSYVQQSCTLPENTNTFTTFRRTRNAFLAPYDYYQMDDVLHSLRTSHFPRSPATTARVLILDTGFPMSLLDDNGGEGARVSCESIAYNDPSSASAPVFVPCGDEGYQHGAQVTAIISGFTGTQHHLRQRFHYPGMAPGALVKIVRIFNQQGKLGDGGDAQGENSSLSFVLRTEGSVSHGRGNGEDTKGQRSTPHAGRVLFFTLLKEKLRVFRPHIILLPFAVDPVLTSTTSEPHAADDFRLFYSQLVEFINDFCVRENLIVVIKSLFNVVDSGGRPPRTMGSEDASLSKEVIQVGSVAVRRDERRNGPYVARLSTLTPTHRRARSCLHKHLAGPLPNLTAASSFEDSPPVGSLNALPVLVALGDSVRVLDVPPGHSNRLGNASSSTRLASGNSYASAVVCALAALAYGECLRDSASRLTSPGNTSAPPPPQYVELYVRRFCGKLVRRVLFETSARLTHGVLTGGEIKDFQPLLHSHVQPQAAMSFLRAALDRIE